MVDKEKLKKYINHWLFLTIICFALFLACCIVSMKYLANYLIDVNADYVEETATITNYETIKRNGYEDYNLCYEYVAPDGTIYSGICMTRIANFDYVEEKLGTKITIYVAHDIHRHKLQLNFEIGYIWQYGLIATIFLITFIIFILKYMSVLKNKDKNKSID